jgi:hypothetical protein
MVIDVKDAVSTRVPSVNRLGRGKRNSSDQYPFNWTAFDFQLDDA